MSTLNFRYELTAAGINLKLNKDSRSLFGKTKSDLIKATDWGNQESLHALSALARLEAIVEDPNDASCQLPDAEGYFLSHSAVTSLTEAQAKSLGLPATVPFTLRVSLNGPLVDPKTSILATWHKSSGQRVRVEDYGSIINDGAQHYRLPSAIHRVLQAIDAINEDDKASLDQHLALISELKLQLAEHYGIEIDQDQQLRSFNLRHAACVSLDIHVENDSIAFDPVLFSRPSLSIDGEPAQFEEDAQLVGPEHQSAFRDLFKHSQAPKPTYVLGRNEYLFIDPALRPALEVIRKAQDLPPEQKVNFAKSPQSFIKQQLLDQGLNDDVADEMVSASFVETDRFSERVLEVGLWRPPVLPFIQRASNTWLPEGFGLKIGTKNIVLPEEVVAPLARDVAKAITEKQETVVHNGLSYEIPATPEVLGALNQLLELVLKQPKISLDSEEKNPEPEFPGSGVTPQPIKTGKSILRVQENFEGANFVARFEPRLKWAGFERPHGLVNKPKDHQVEGVEWLQQAWCGGFPGVLLADDMGLGKTFQTLAFMCWLAEKRKQIGLPHNPVLIVAPTTLLGNWQQEAAIHIDPFQLGDTVLLYGGFLKGLRLPGETSNDVVAGHQTLDVDQITRANWVLTTYETMRDHHISLASIPFSCIVFDEMQKIKSPKSMMTNAAQALNGDFIVGLTGTPIENSLSDIWTLFDTLMPGALGWGDLKTFVNNYTIDEPEKLKELKELLQNGKDNMPPPMLRRMKYDVAKDLPQKLETVIDVEMPREQADQYQLAVSLGVNAGKKGDKREAFQQMRGISLHPFFPDSEEAQDAESYVRQSARLKACIDILDKVKAKGEKALVFIESIAMHEWLSFYLKQRYQLDRTPDRIYGAITSEARTKIVSRFQDNERKGLFDVLLLSPKAAGVGITLTAATHVIHLSRWWNPAVEDQCTDRAYRIGQDKDVNVYVPRSIHPLYGQQSFDCILHDLLERKRSLSREMLIPMETGDEIDSFFNEQ